MTVLACCSVFIAAVACVASAAAPPQIDPTVYIPGQGTARGAIRDGGGALSRAFLGLPFAVPPLLERRFRPPSYPAAPWDGERAATAFSPPCAQLGPLWPTIQDVDRASEDWYVVHVLYGREPRRV